MPHSMTGFASHLVVAGTNEFTWELRSVNHRFLDVSLRLPEELRRLEPACRELAGKFLSRGKLDCTLRAAPDPGAEARPRLNPDVVANLQNLQREVHELLPDARALSVADILRFEGAIIDPRVVADASVLADTLLRALAEAFGLLVDARRGEGERIAEFLLQRVTAIEAAIHMSVPIASSGA